METKRGRKGNFPRIARCRARAFAAACAVLFACAATPVRGAPLFERWTVTGDALVNTEDIRRLLPWSPGDTLSPERLDAASSTVRDALVARGYWSADVRATAPEIDGRVPVTVHVAAGEPALIGSIQIAGNRVLAREEILALLGMREGSRIETRPMREGIDRVLRAYGERGYPLARVSPGAFQHRPDGRIAWTIQIGEGPETFIEEVRVIGKSSTSPDVLARIAGVRPGTRWDARRVDQIATRLRREELFTYVGEPRVVRGSRDNQLGIEIDVESRKTSSILGVLGYVPEPEGGGSIVGLVDLRLGNILGTARRAAFHFERSAQDVRDLSFRYHEPWLLGSPISLELGAAQALRDTLYSRTDLDVAISVPIGWGATASLAGERRSSSFDEVAGVASVDELSTGGSFALAVERRDDRLDPSHGFAGAARVGVRQTEGHITRTRLETGLEVILPLRGRWLFAEGLAYQGVWANAGDIPLSDQYYFGGTTTLRGYREEQFHGERVWWARSELRYHLARRSRAYLFGDVGGYDFSERDASGFPVVREDVLAGGGAGMAVATRGSGIMRVELALGRGDGFSDAKVHVALEQEF